MKKVFYLAVAAMAVLSSCDKENLVIDGGAGTATFNAPVFTATIENHGTKTSLGNAGKVNWENGDEVFMFFVNEVLSDQAAYVYEATPGDDASTATLTWKSNITPDNPAADRLMYAVYPASLFNVYQLVFPATQVYGGDDNIGFAPMASMNYTIGDHLLVINPTPENLTFKNVAALLKITVPYSQMESVQSITVSSDKAMHGVSGFETESGSPELTIEDVYSPENSYVTLDCAAGNDGSNVAIPADGNKTFYISIPVNTYGYLQIDITDGTTTKSMRTNKAGGIQIERNKIYPINFAENYTVAAWETALTLGRYVSNGPTSIEIETGVNVSSYTVDATHKSLNAAGTLWEVLDGEVLRIQTSSNKIIAPVNSSGLFGRYFKVESITGLDKLDMSAVTNIEDLFTYCQELRSLNLSSFNTSNVTNMGSMFFNCCNLTEIIGIENLNTSNVTNMSEMFNSCSGLTALDVSNFVTSNVENMRGMFYYCQALQELDLSNFDTENVTDMSYMFNACESLSALDVTHFDTQNVTNMIRMFNGCESLSALDVAYFNTSNVTDMYQMFEGCKTLESLDITSFDTKSVENMQKMFAMCTHLTSLRIGENFSMSNVTDKGDMFEYCGSESEGPSFRVSAVNNDDDELEFDLSYDTGWNWNYMVFDQIWE